jgi:hypothetical protein
VEGADECLYHRYIRLGTHVIVCLTVCVDGWKMMDGWMYESMGGCMYELMDGWTHEMRRAWIDGCMDIYARDYLYTYMLHLLHFDCSNNIWCRGYNKNKKSSKSNGQNSDPSSTGLGQTLLYRNLHNLASPCIILHHLPLPSTIWHHVAIVLA